MLNNANIKKIFIDAWPNLPLFCFIVELNNLLNDCGSVLDLGCGSISPIRYLVEDKYLVGVDGHKQSIQKAKDAKTHDELLTMDVMKVSKKFKKNSYDAVIALDLIEHLKKKDGIKLLKDMEKIAKKKVILLTPNGYIHQENKENELQEHLSGWSMEDFIKSGYKVRGMYGIKYFRGEEAELKRPKTLWGVVSLLSHFFYTKYIPGQSYSLICTKDFT